ncbi:MAG: hypothetical protein ACLVH3_17325 [Blautia obeum]
MFLSGGGTQNVLAAEDEVTITLDANGRKAVEPVVYKKTQSEIGILPETTRTEVIYLMAGGQRTVEHLLQILHEAGIVKFNDTSLPSSDTTYYARWTEDKAENNKQDTYFYGKTDEKVDKVTYNYGYISDSTARGITYNYGHIEKASARVRIIMVILIALYLVLGLLHIIMERLQTVRTRLHIIMEL